jgi:xanthine dehydrogenase YagR molybdenum-binding subunit
MSADQVLGRPINRVDGLAKVTGAAPYSAEFKFDGICYAVVVPSLVAKGRVMVDAARASRLPGVLLVMSSESAMRLPNGGHPPVEPPTTRALTLLQDDQVHYNGQPVAVIVAETLEQASEAARILDVSYQEAAPLTDFDAVKSSAHEARSDEDKKASSKRGDPDGAFARAPFTVDAVYSTPMEFHNAMEPHATIAFWQGDQLTLHDSTQAIMGLKSSCAKVFGITADKVRTVCPFTGGGFGSKGSMWSHVILAAMAAKAVNRPVKLVLERPQMFMPVGFRPRTEQHLLLGASNDGQLIAMRHDTISSTSTIEDWSETSGVVTRMLYACDNQSTSHRVAPMNIGTPTFMRAPGESSGTFALESAMDELAQTCGIDPVALRLTNYTDIDPGQKKPFSQKALKECYRIGAERFGWERRSALPRSRRAGTSLVGLGMATATYPANRKLSEAMARLNADGSVVVRAATQDLGTGTYTIMTQIAAQTLGFPLRSVRFELGDSLFPDAPVSGGSTTAASVGPAVQAACKALRTQIIDAALSDPNSALYQVTSDDIDVTDGWLIRSSNPDQRDAAAAVIGRRRGQPLEAHGSANLDKKNFPYSAHSFGAVFAEVHVDETLHTLTVERLTGVYDVGTLMNEKTARSQLMGGMVWGISMALLEEGQMDQRYGRIVNNNLAEYHVPVNADIRALDIVFVPSSDTQFNPLGARGIGEIGITGVAAAIANAVYNATGKRVRDLPITLDKLT